MLEAVLLSKSLFLLRDNVHCMCTGQRFLPPLFSSLFSLTHPHPSPIWMATTPPLLSSADQPGHTSPCWPTAKGACPCQQESYCGGMAHQRGQHTTEIQTGKDINMHPFVLFIHIIHITTSTFLLMCRTWQRSTRKHCSCWGSSRPSFWMTSWSSGRDGNSWRATGVHRREAWTSCSPGEFSSTSHQDHSH